ncbi:hypothetical protein SCHPADRAFT_942553 [Schizopora paradoxa]|uniref:SPT2-domain-containing protein n=1 Tax=Schizopora paradoxa TaxID=27342 RepID=A0A0H2RN02_9AGAM|nr:hypothetical protein SCHPADRAFT_942553 [Schizopora paradoxa]
MSARFADLMALSVSQTREAAREAQALLDAKKAREEAIRKEQVERMKKEKEIRMRRVAREMEEARLKEEQERKAEEEKRKREEQKLRHEEEQKRALIYGPKANKSNGAGGKANGAARSAPRGKGSKSDDELEAGAMALTREEKRQKKLNADLNKGWSTATRKSTSGGAYSKHGRVLKGGAIDATTSNVFSYAPTAGTEHLSVKERIAATPNYLQRLNTVKRDTRTIDEIMRDRQKAREAKVLAGDEAKEFHDWFSSKPKKDPLSAVQKLSSSQPSASSTPTRGLTPIPASSSQPKSSATTPAAPPSPNKPSANNSTRPSQRPSPRPEPVVSQPKTKITLVKPQQASTSLLGKTAIKSATPAPPPKTSSQPVKSSNYASTSAQSRPRSSSGSVKKRAFSESLDDDSDFESRSPSPPYKKRAHSTSAKNDLSSQIWQMFGKDRSRYMKADVYSDEEDDMEVDADALRREELRSARIAKKEDEEALREETRHEEEKRRKRKEKERRG